MPVSKRTMQAKRCIHGFETVICKTCGSALRKSNTGSPRPSRAGREMASAVKPELAMCADCSSQVRSDRMSRHQAQVHGPKHLSRGRRGGRRVMFLAEGILDEVVHRRGFKHRGVHVRYEAEHARWVVNGKHFRSPTTARLAVNRQVDSTGEPASTSVRAASAGLPSLGKRR